MQQPTHSAAEPGENPQPARINGIALHALEEQLDAETLRQRACMELLRQAAIHQGFLSGWDKPGTDGVMTEEASQAIEGLLEQNLQVPMPDEEACQRHYAAHPATYTQGEQVHLRHILFAVTPGVNVVALRQRAEQALLDVRCHDGSGIDRFAESARELSNCPSGAQGGALGWLQAKDCAPEFAREVFALTDVGVLPRLVHSRFGLHVVEVLERKPGQLSAYQDVRGAVAMALQQNSYATALRQFIAMLAGDAVIDGVDLEGATSPLVQ